MAAAPGLAYEPPRVRIAQDFELLGRALRLYEEQSGRYLTGTSFAPLVGRYLQELPLDPWGRPYLVDASAGVVATFGEDGEPDTRSPPRGPRGWFGWRPLAQGAPSDDDDRVGYLRSPLHLVDAHLWEGNTWPAPDAPAGGPLMLTLAFNKPLMLLDPEYFPHVVVLVEPAQSQPGYNLPLSSLCGECAWKVVPRLGGDAASVGTDGRVYLEAEHTTELSGWAKQKRAWIRLDLDRRQHLPGTLEERRERGQKPPSPLDPDVWGADGALRWIRPPEAVLRGRDGRGGVPLEEG